MMARHLGYVVIQGLKVSILGTIAFMVLAGWPDAPLAFVIALGVWVGLTWTFLEGLEDDL